MRDVDSAPLAPPVGWLAQELTRAKPSTAAAVPSQRNRLLRNDIDRFPSSHRSLRSFGVGGETRPPRLRFPCGMTTMAGPKVGRLALSGVARAACRCAFDLMDQPFELGDFIAKGGLPGRREADPGAGALAFIPFFDVHESGFFQHGQVLSEIAGCEVEGGAQEAELRTSGFVGDDQDAQPHALVDDVVELAGGMRHGPDRPPRRPASAKPKLPINSTPPSMKRRGRKSHGDGCGMTGPCLPENKNSTMAR